MQIHECEDLRLGADVKVSMLNWEVPLPESRKKTTELWDKIHESFVVHFDLCSDISDDMGSLKERLLNRSGAKTPSPEYQKEVNLRKAERTEVVAQARTQWSRGSQEGRWNVGNLPRRDEVDQ